MLVDDFTLTFVGDQTFGNELIAYLSQQVLMVYGCVSETNRHILLLGGHRIPFTESASFYRLGEEGILPRSIAHPMRRRLARLRNRIAHPKPPGEVEDLYQRTRLLVETIYKYLQSIEEYLEAQY